MSKKNENAEKNIKSSNPDKKSIKYGILYQNSDLININDLFNIYLDKEKPNIIKNTNKGYEFSLEKYENLYFHFEIIPEEELKNIYNIYSFFNFFLIFVDIQSTACKKILESYINSLIDCSQDNTKKSYIFGVYKDGNSIINKDEQITTILNCKGIDYEYSEININLNEQFPKGVDYLIEDSQEIMEEIEFEEIHNKFNRDKGKSCIII